ncbi:MAG: YjjG family noncanonical pyrimidine nucleotidase [Bacilli bacterium]|nr:YjjG family noncanonical pyrimidine nucleotidase [Bacilli bacterium]MBP5550522.1 YjjG family noncanonical pyrimidine nucleotidase [Bacilli bacterium]
MYKYLLIDCDDTILDFGKSERASIAQVMEKYGVSPTVKAVEKYVKLNEKFWRLFEKGKITKERLLELRFIKFFKKYKIDVDGKAINKEYLETLTHNVFVINGIEDVLKYLKDKGYKLYIITNGVKSTQIARWNQTDLLKYFDGAFISEEIGYFKPQKEYFEYVVSNIGDSDLSNYLVIGDSISSDITGGINYNIDVAWFNPKKKKSKIKVDYEFHSLDDYYKYL